MPKIVDVKDKTEGKVIQMQAIDAKEAVDNDPGRYSMKGYSKAAEDPQDVVPRRARPTQTVNTRMTAKQSAQAADLSSTSGEPGKPVNVSAQERAADADEALAGPTKTRRKAPARKK